MKKINTLILFIFSVIFVGCKEEGKFPIEKRFWDTEDYQEVVRQLKYGYKDGETLPNLNDPETSIIVQKMLDQQNFNVVLDDSKLGLNHKNKVAEDFFSIWKDMVDIYDSTDRKDKYLYEVERLKVWHFGLALQKKYFELGNIRIKEKADDPNSASIQSLVNRNVGVLISNYQIYLDEINNENSYSEKGWELIAEGVNKYLSDLVIEYPKSSFKSLSKKASLLSNKTKSPKIKLALESLVKLITTRNRETVNN